MRSSKIIKRAIALLMTVCMLCIGFAGVTSSIAMAATSGSSEAGAKHPEANSIQAEQPSYEDKGGVRLYAYRSWSENADEQRDFVTFTTLGLEDIETLWPYSEGMIAAEYFNGVLYVVDDNLGFSAVNIEDGTAERIATLDYIVNDMTYDYTSSTMFCLIFNYAVGASQIARINLETGEISPMGTFDSSINMMTISAGREPGVLYGTDGSGIVYSFDVYGNCVQIADTGFSIVYGSSSTYCYEDDMLYWQHNPGQEIVKIDPATGVVTVLGNLSNYTTLTGITTIPDPEDLPENNGNHAVTDVILNTDELLLSPGLSKQLSVTIVPYNADDQSVTWSSSDETVAVVDENGIVTGVATGEATVTVTSVEGNHTDTCHVQVTDVPVTFLAYRLYADDGVCNDYVSFTDIEPNNVQSKWQGTFELYGSEYCNGTLYGSDYINQRFVTIDPETGEMTPIGFCQYAFTALSYDYESGVMYGISYANGTNQSIFAINIDTAEQTLICTVRSDESFNAFTHAGNGNFYAIDESGNLCTIDDHGFVEVVGPTGFTNVSMIQSMTYDYYNECLYWAHASSGELVKLDPETAEHIVLGVIGNGGQYTALTVIRDEAYTPDLVDLHPVTGVLVEPDCITIAPGITTKLDALIYPWNADNKSVSWISSDPSVASVDAEGNVLGISGGTAFVTVTTVDGNYTSSAQIIVLDDGIELRGSRVFSNGAYGDLIRFYDYGLPNVESDGFPRSEIYAGEYYDGIYYGYAQNTGLLFAIDPETGDSRIVGPCYYQLCEMAFDYTTGSMYCMVLENDVKCLARINIDTAEVTIVGSFDAPEQLLTLSGGRDGSFFGISFEGNLYRIDASAHCELVGSTGFTANYLQSMTYDYRTDSIYWAQYPDGQLIKVDPETGIGTCLGSLEDCPEIAGLYTICEDQYLPERVPGAPVEGIYLNRSEIKIEINMSQLLAAVVLPYNAENRSVTWTSSDESIVIVNEDGVITAVSEGRATVTAVTADGGYSASATVTVVEHGTELYAYRNNGIDIYNDWISFTDTAPSILTSLWDAQQEIYGAAYYDGYLYAAYRFGALIRANIETGEYTLVGYCQTGYQTWGMTYDYTTNTMFALVYEENSNTLLLAKVNLETAQFEDMVAFSGSTDIRTIAAGRNGLYALDAGGNLLSVKYNGVCTVIASLGFDVPFVTSMVYDYERDVFIWSQNCWGFNQDSYLVSLDPNTGEREILGIIGEGGNQPILTALVLIPDAQDLPGDVMPGDVNLNGTITMDDAMLAARHAMGIIVLSGNSLIAADVNGDEAISFDDALLIMRMTMGI